MPQSRERRPRPATARACRRCRALLLLALLLPAAAPGFAQTGSPAAATAPPVAFALGADVRFREESLHNLLDFNDAAGPADPKLVTLSDAQYFRGRHRLWGQLKLRSGPRLYSRLTTEWRKYFQPYLTPQRTEVILDNLYLDLPRPAGLPLTLRVGRQDIMRGEGFILLEGGPGDGSRSIYHNAILLTLEGAKLGLGRTQVDLLAIRNPAWDEFVVANGPTETEKYRGSRKPMVENDETAFGVYATHALSKTRALEAYYFYKEEERPADALPRLRLHTLGARFAGSLPWQLRAAAEGAYQFGDHRAPCYAVDDRCGCYCYPKHASFGGYAHISREVIALFKPTLELGGIYLSGDDPADARHPLPGDRSWVPLFSRWPKWSELLIYTQIPEAGRVANWTNLISAYGSLAITLTNRIQLSYAYYYLRAPYPLVDPAGEPPTGLFGIGRVRGHNHQWKLTTQLSESVSGHFLVERFAPGDFYHQARDDAFFVRWELMWKL
jgi:hypothetical protein